MIITGKYLRKQKDNNINLHDLLLNIAKYEIKNGNYFSIKIEVQIYIFRYLLY